MATSSRRIRPKIKPPKKHGPDVSIDQTWNSLANNIREIQNQNAVNLSFEENHRFAYNLVLHREGEKLYDGVKGLVREDLDKHANEDIKPVFPTSASDDPVQRSQEGEILLKAMARFWEQHKSNMVKLGMILKYMDRVYTKSARVPETWDVGLELFLERIICPPIQEHLVSTIIMQIELERDGYTINRSAVKGCVGVLLGLDSSTGVTVYEKLLEPRVLDESRDYYLVEGVKLIDTCTAPEFLRRVQSRFESEEARAQYYLSERTAWPLQQILQTYLLTPHLDTVISMPNSGIDVMIDLDKVDDLSRLYRIFTSVAPGLPCLRRHLKESVVRRGKLLNAASLDVGDAAVGPSKAKGVRNAAQILTQALTWVQDVLDLKDKFDGVWKKAFESNRDLESALTESFTTFINANEKCAEYISLFIDDNLKKGLKGKSESEVDLVLDKTITVFRFIQEKDVFERYYKGHLSKRLLQGRSVSEDAERGMLAKLKVESGYQFTQKLEGMFNDMKVSDDTMQLYRKHLTNSLTSLEIDLSVIVMTATCWPVSSTPPSCLLPTVMTSAIKSYEQFYFTRHNGRRLTWQYGHGNADVKVRFNTKRHDLNVSTFALVILLLFEDLEGDEFLTYEEIKNATSIEDSELKRQLQSLACAKFKILKKHPAGRDVDPSDSFSFNADFTAPMQKIKISTVSAKVESVDERMETKVRIEEERKHQADACIVRIMKDRKHMTHNELVNEVTRQLASRFQPNPLSIKKRIENLIEREYLERCDDRKSYNYLA